MRNVAFLSRGSLAATDDYFLDRSLMYFIRSSQNCDLSFLSFLLLLGEILPFFFFLEDITSLKTEI